MLRDADESEPTNRNRGVRAAHKPRLQRLLASLRLNVSYERGQGAHLFYRDQDGIERSVLDLVGGFGSVLMGHSHPILINEAQRLLSRGVPFHSQGSRQASAEELARALSDRARGDYCCVFSNSGTEAVEVALKHAMLETGGRTVIAVEGGFHGKTLGAVQTIGNAEYRAPFELSGLPVIRVRRNDLSALEMAFYHAKSLAGFLFEPIQGEGGVRPLSAEFVQRAAHLCADRHVPLIADECQTGSGRTGRFLACEELGVRPDYVLLSKSLGGGLVKMAATLIRRSRYRDEFDIQHTSTFAADSFSSTLTLKMLELLDAALLNSIRELGSRLLRELCRLQESYPDIIAEVRGRGLMLGVQFRPLPESQSLVLRLLSSQNELLHLLSGYLLHVHSIRVFPTLSDPWTIRLQPPVCFSDADLRQLMTALEDVCQRLRKPDLPGLSRFLMESESAPNEPPVKPDPHWKFVAFDETNFRAAQSSISSRRVAWLCHMLDADALTPHEPGLEVLSYSDREQLIERFSSFACPVVMSAVDVASKNGEVLRFYPIMLPFTSRMVKQWLDARQLSWCRTLIRGGIEMARTLGCDFVSLGQYTSIATCNGRALADLNIGLTSGNTYTVALTVQAIEQVLAERSLDPAASTLAVVGAAGNIGQICAELLAPRFARTVLVGSGSLESKTRLDRLALKLPRARIAESVLELPQAQVVLAALNAVDRPLGPEHFGSGAIVCDVSVPSAIRTGTADQRPDVTFFKGGLSSLPGGEDLRIASFPLPPGQAYGCLAEGLILGMAGISDTTFTGPVTSEKVARVTEWARRFGFQLVDYKRSCVFGSG